MTLAELTDMIEKAGTRKDGIYPYRGYLYVVIDHKFVAFATRFGECYQRSGLANILIGKTEPYNRKRDLNNWLKGLKK